MIRFSPCFANVFSDSKGRRPKEATIKEIQRIDFGTLDPHQTVGRAVQNIGGAGAINVYGGNVSLSNVHITQTASSGMYL